MAAIALKTPTNAVPLQSDAVAGEALAGDLREIVVSKGTSAVLVTATDAGGVNVAFWIQGPDDTAVDGQAKAAHAMPFAAGAKWARTGSLEDPSQGRVEAVAWSFWAAADAANAVFLVHSDFSRGI